MIEKNEYGRPQGFPTPLEYWKNKIDDFVKSESIELNTVDGLKKLMQYTLILSCIEVYNSDGMAINKIPSEPNAHIEFIRQYIQKSHPC